MTVKLNFLPINQSGAMVLGEDKGFEKATRNQLAITPRKLGGAHSQMIPPFLLAHPLFPLTASDLGLMHVRQALNPCTTSLVQGWILPPETICSVLKHNYLINS